MTRLSQVLFASLAFAAVPLTAFAQDAEPPGDPTAPPADPTAPAAETAPGWSKSVIERPLTLLKGKLGAAADLYIARFSPPPILGMAQDSVTSEGLQVGAGYGITDKLEVGGSYGFALNEFEIKGTLDVYGAFSLVHSAKLDIGASADLAINLAGEDATETINAGVAVRYKITPKMAVYTGSPIAPGPLGQQLTLGLNDGAAKTFSLPVGFGIQATPELFAHLDTGLLSITLSDVPDGADRVATIIDATPLSVGAIYAVNKNIDAALNFGFPDVQNADTAFLITVGARYYN